MSARAPFDPKDDFEVAASTVAAHIVQSVAASSKAASAFNRLSPEQQVEACLCGGLTGLVCVLLASTDKSCHDEMMRIIADYLPHARESAESFAREGLH